VQDYYSLSGYNTNLGETKTQVMYKMYTSTHLKTERSIIIFATLIIPQMEIYGSLIQFAFSKRQRVYKQSSSASHNWQNPIRVPA